MSRGMSEREAGRIGVSLEEKGEDGSIEERFLTRREPARSHRRNAKKRVGSLRNDRKVGCANPANGNWIYCFRTQEEMTRRWISLVPS
jgi:hypothetical protein